MHRSPLSALVIFAAITACSTRDASAETELLARDATLVTRLARAEAPRSAEAPRRATLPDACGTVGAAVRPAAAAVSQADELARRGYDAEAHGDLQAARSLLGRASELDGTNESVAYHLGRAHEALGDRSAAVTAYCRFLSLTPTTAESDEARQRVARLAQPAALVATGTDRAAAVTRPPRATPSRRVTRPVTSPVTRRRAPVAPRAVASAPAARPRVQATNATTTVDASPSVTESAAPVGEGATGPTSAQAAGDVVPSAVESVNGTTPIAPATAGRTSRGGLSTAQRAGIGAAAGAIIGAVTGRSVKGALIGAAAGGVLGTVVGGGIGPAGRGIRPTRPYRP